MGHSRLPLSWPQERAEQTLALGSYRHHSDLLPFRVCLLFFVAAVRAVRGRKQMFEEDSLREKALRWAEALS